LEQRNGKDVAEGPLFPPLFVGASKFTTIVAPSFAKMALTALGGGMVDFPSFLYTKIDTPRGKEKKYSFEDGPLETTPTE